MIPDNKWKKIGRACIPGQTLRGWDQGPNPLTAERIGAIIQVMEGSATPDTLTMEELKWLERKVNRLAVQQIKYQNEQNGGSVSAASSSSLH
jgi:hypothetical protein